MNQLFECPICNDTFHFSKGVTFSCLCTTCLLCLSDTKKILKERNGEYTCPQCSQIYRKDSISLPLGIPLIDKQVNAINKWSSSYARWKYQFTELQRISYKNALPHNWKTDSTLPVPIKDLYELYNTHEELIERYNIIDKKIMNTFSQIMAKLSLVKNLEKYMDELIKLLPFFSPIEKLSKLPLFLKLGNEFYCFDIKYQWETDYGNYIIDELLILNNGHLTFINDYDETTSLKSNLSLIYSEIYITLKSDKIIHKIPSDKIINSYYVDGIWYVYHKYQNNYILTSLTSENIKSISVDGYDSGFSVLKNHRLYIMVMESVSIFTMNGLLKHIFLKNSNNNVFFFDDFYIYREYSSKLKLIPY